MYKFLVIPLLLRGQAPAREKGAVAGRNALGFAAVTRGKVDTVAAAAGRGEGDKITVSTERRLFIAARAKGNLSFLAGGHILDEDALAIGGQAAVGNECAVRGNVGLGIIASGLADTGDGAGTQVF